MVYRAEHKRQRHDEVSLTRRDRLERTGEGYPVTPPREKSFLYIPYVAIGGLAVVLVLLATVGATVSDLNEAGKAAYSLGDYVAAERLFSEASAQAPEDPLLRMTNVFLHRSSGRS